jgi:hypothetical protein
MIATGKPAQPLDFARDRQDWHSGNSVSLL